MRQQQTDSQFPLRLFISYAHEDEPMRQQLETHLRPLQRQGLIASWHDRLILAGEERTQQIDEHLKTASIILLLISPDFLASDYYYSYEMERALQRHRAKEARVIPILVRPCDWQRDLLGSLQALPQNTRPISLWADKDEAWTSVAGELRRMLEQSDTTTVPIQHGEQENYRPGTSYRLKWTHILGGLILLALVLSGVLIESDNVLHHSATVTPPTAETNSSKTAKTSATASQSTTDPYSTKNTLEVNDDLTSATANLAGWEMGTHCFFRQHAYNVLAQGLMYCEADHTNFSDFVYQIQLKIIGGTTAGIIFRTNNINAETYYIFEMTIDGTFFIQRNDSSENDTWLRKSSSSAAIHTGLKASNLLAVDANGNKMTFYINGSVVAQVTDSQYQSGVLGVIVGQQNTPSDAHTTTEAAYNNARVWT